jgi:hypothetical protein
MAKPAWMVTNHNLPIRAPTSGQGWNKTVQFAIGATRLMVKRDRPSTSSLNHECARRFADRPILITEGMVRKLYVLAVASPSANHVATSSFARSSNIGWIILKVAVHANSDLTSCVVKACCHGCLTEIFAKSDPIMRILPADVSRSRMSVPTTIIHKDHL